MKESLLTNIYKFSTQISKYEFTTYFYTIIWIPNDIVDLLKDKTPPSLLTHPKLRIKAEVEGVYTEGALMPDRGRWYYMTPSKLLKKIKKNVGDTVEIQLEVIQDQDLIELPPEMFNFLQLNPHIKKKWENLTHGKKRTLLVPFVKARTKPTQEKRLIEIQEYLESLE